MNLKWRLFCITILGLLIGHLAKGASLNEYIITETDQPTSLDPLDADLTQNLPVARMIYATPMEIDASDVISSQVLESFSYDKKSKSINWIVKKGLKFSNGLDLTPDDIAFAVARMAFTRPKFPVIEFIDGLAEWLKLPHPLSGLPKGITVNGQTITLQLKRDVAHPLFRFCLELFSIIPKSCVDPKSNRVTCEPIPTSGRYSIAARTSDAISFKRQGTVDGPEEISFRYIPAAELLSRLASISSDAIIAGNESFFSEEELKKFSAADSFYFLPAARFAVLQINPQTAPFKDKLCRSVFTTQFRTEYEKITANYSPSESSIFTKLLPGYLSRTELESGSNARASQTEQKACLQKFHLADLKWGYVEKEKNSAFVQAMLNTIKTLGIKGKPKILKDRKELADKFIDGDLDLMGAGSGFWANDPVGDLQMLFTPNLHRALDFITADRALQHLIEDLERNQDDKSKYFAVNRYLYDEGLFNVYSHIRRFYFSKSKSRLKQIPQGASAPTPWQVFK
jgi:ABC-type transport system substrate-binding protein